jgi:hypothetical protein
VLRREREGVRVGVGDVSEAWIEDSLGSRPVVMPAPSGGGRGDNSFQIKTERLFGNLSI